MKTGLTLGKFSPLHCGHQLVIETALREVDQLLVMIYDSPETTSIPLPVRAAWLKKLYPQAEIVEAWDGPAEVGYTPEIMRLQETFILKRLNGRKITHFYSSEPYGEHVSIALGAENRTVDQGRSTVPISGTRIRANPFSSRQFMPDVVYRDHITNVVFLGAPSTGKTSMAEAMAADFNTVWMPEYGREYWETHQVNRRLTLQQLVEIAAGHLIREDAALLQARDYLFTDTNVLTTRIFSYYYHDSAAPDLENMALQHAGRYDLVFLCDIDIPFDNTWDRSGEVNRATMQKQIIADLHCRKIPFITLRGDLEARKSQVRQTLAAFKKFANFWGSMAILPATRP